MIRNWVVFEGRPNGRDPETARVTLNKKGMFLMNKAAFEALGKAEAVLLMFDKANQSIGLIKTNPDRDNAFPVKEKDKYSNRTVAAAPFCKDNAIRVETTVQFNGITIGRDGIMTLDLAKTTIIGRGH